MVLISGTRHNHFSVDWHTGITFMNKINRKLIVEYCNQYRTLDDLTSKFKICYPNMVVIMRELVNTEFLVVQRVKVGRIRVNKYIKTENYVAEKPKQEIPTKFDFPAHDPFNLTGLHHNG